MTRAALALALVLSLSGAGCASSDAAPDPDAVAAARGLGDRDFQDAAEELAQKLHQRGQRGWPANVALAGEPPRPVVRLVSTNRSRELIDMRAFDDRVAATLSAADAADMAAGGAEGALVLDASISDEVTDTPDTRRVDYTISFVLTEPGQGGVLVSSVTRLARVHPKQ